MESDSVQISIFLSVEIRSLVASGAIFDRVTVQYVHNYASGD